MVRDLVAGTTKIASIGMNGSPASLGTLNYGLALRAGWTGAN